MRPVVKHSCKSSGSVHKRYTVLWLWMLQLGCTWESLENLYKSLIPGPCLQRCWTHWAEVEARHQNFKRSPMGKICSQGWEPIVLEWASTMSDGAYIGMHILDIFQDFDPLCDLVLIAIQLPLGRKICSVAYSLYVRKMILHFIGKAGIFENGTFLNEIEMARLKWNKITPLDLRENMIKKKENLK